MKKCRVWFVAPVVLAAVLAPTAMADEAEANPGQSAEEAAPAVEGEAAHDEEAPVADEKAPAEAPAADEATTETPDIPSVESAATPELLPAGEVETVGTDSPVTDSPVEEPPAAVEITDAIRKEAAQLAVDGEARLAKGDAAAAAALFERALELDQEGQKTLRRSLGIAHARLGDPDAAADQYRMYVLDNPDAEDAADLQEIVTRYDAGEPVEFEIVHALGEGEEEVSAAPADQSSEEPETPKKPWSVSVTNSFAYGLQVDDATAYNFDTLSFSGRYEIMDKVSVSAGLGFYFVPFGSPNDAVRANMTGFNVGLSHSSFYKDEAYTGINVSGGISLGQRAGLGLSNNPSYPSISVRTKLSRTLADIDLGYGLSFNKANPRYAIVDNQQCIADRNGPYCSSSWAVDWSMTNSFSAGYSPMDELSLSASLALIYTRTFGEHAPTATRPETVQGPADVRHAFGFSLRATYTTPIEGLSAGIGFSNGGPWQSTGNSLYNPIFDPRLAAMSIDVSYSY